MSKNKLTLLGILVIVLGIFAFSSLFTVHQTKQVLVLQFGQHVRTIKEPGLNFKLPFLQNVVEYESRILSFDPPAETVILSDQKRMIVDAFVRYKIDDPLNFYKTVRSERGVLSRLNGVVDSSLRQTLGNVTLLTVLSDERAKIMNDIKETVDEVAQRFGIKIVDVRLRRADLPDQAAQAIYARMRSEREREAREKRAQGFEKAQQIRSSADRERSVLLAEAEKQSEITRGVGDKTAIRIYADAYGADPEFYGFYRSMQAYRKAFADDDTTMVLSPDSEFFRYFGDLHGGKKLGGN
jgi:modulator of FtsH protease HflC